MDFNFTEEQLSMQDTLNRFISNNYGFEARRKRVAAGDTFDPAVWNTLAELGYLALPFPEALGGFDGTAIDTYLVMRTMAPGLVLEPYLSTVILSGTLLQETPGEDRKAALIEEIITGKARYCFAHYEPEARYHESHVATQAKQDGEHWVLSGHKAAVLDVKDSDYLLVSARTAGNAGEAEGISIFRLRPETAGLEIKSYPTHDGHSAADVILDNVRLDSDALIGTAGQAAPAIAQALAITNTALVAEATGLIEALNNATLEYLKIRKQFGVAIGTFQALQHRMAEMAIAAEQANSMALLAAMEMANPSLEERVIRASAAKAYVGQLARHVGQEAVQMHGGIGVTDELDVAHFFKRITTINMMFGDVDFHFERYSDSLLNAS